MDRIGKYIVLEEIGQGGMGVVYKARDPVIGREVAVKVIIERIMRSPDLKERFLREIASAGRLSHENIMTIYDAGDHEERPYFVMELLSGTDLSTVIRRGSLSLDEKLAIAVQVARGLRYAHERGVIHRDIKPDNVRVLSSGRAKIMDFGIARVESATRTPTHSSIGTPRYMSPEQIKGEHVDRRTDIFSFGALFYELLTGTPPFAGERITTVIYKILHEGPAPVDLGDVTGADALHRIVDRCLEKELDARYGSFDEVLRDLEAVIAERNTVTPTLMALPPLAEEPPREAAVDETIVLPLDRSFLTPPAAPERTLAEPTLTAAGSAPPERTARAFPVRTVALGAVGVLALLGLTYVIAQPGGGSDEGETVATEPVYGPAEESLARPFAPTDTNADALDPDAFATDAPMGGVEPPAAPPAESPAASPAERAEEPDAAGRAEAEAQRSRMQAAKALADRVDAASAAGGLYERAAAQERSAATAFRRGTAYAAARTAYAEATRLYGEARTAAVQRQEAEQARQAMAQARAAVVDRRADPRIADDFQRAEARRTTAERQLRDGAFRQAAASFGEAGTLYAEAAQTASRPAAEPTPEPARQPEPTPPEPSPEERAQAAAEQAAGALAARLRQALEREDAGAMRGIHSTYGGWDGFFRIADNVRATVSVGAVSASAGSATADVSVRIQFRNTSKNQDETTNVRYVWTLEPRGDAWGLTSVATR